MAPLGSAMANLHNSVQQAELEWKEEGPPGALSPELTLLAGEGARDRGSVCA